MAVAVTFCYNHETSEVIIARPDRTLATEPGDFLERSTVRRFASRYPEETDGSVQAGAWRVRFLVQLRFTNECSIDRDFVARSESSRRQSRLQAALSLIQQNFLPTALLLLGQSVP